MNPVERAGRAAWKPRDDRSSWQWCEDNVFVDRTSPFPGRWRSQTSPWVTELMECADDSRITFLAVKCAAQSSKTQTILNLLCHTIAEDPGPTMYVMANNDDAEDFVRDRVSPMFAACKPVHEVMLRETKLNFTFTTMPLYFRGAGSPGKLQGKPIKKLLLDEVRNYPPGAYDTVLKRVRAFGELAQVLLISTPGPKGDAVDRAYMGGDQRVFHFPCPKCSHLQPLLFEQLKWDTNEKTKPEGRWDFDKLAPTIRYQCANPACDHVIRDTHAERKAICREGRFIKQNPNAPSHHVSFTWNALLPWWVKWRSIVEEFINARYSARQGDLEPLRTFITETLAESWEDELGVIDDFSFLSDRQQDYDYGEAWAEEVARFMAADKQTKGGEHYWYVIRAFGRFGKSRLIAYGRCNSYIELEEIRKQHNVPACNSTIDSAFRRNEVLRFCIASGWKAMLGDSAEHFLARDEKAQKVFRQLWKAEWAQPEGVRKLPRTAKRVRLFRWSNSWVFDLLAEFYTGLVGEWSLPKNVGRDYLKQVAAMQRRERVDTKGRVIHEWHQVFRDNHLHDCECMILASAVITKLIGSHRTPVTRDAAA